MTAQEMDAAHAEARRARFRAACTCEEPEMPEEVDERGCRLQLPAVARCQGCGGRLAVGHPSR